MPKAVKVFVHSVDAVNTVVGKFSMYLVFLMIGNLLYEPFARNLFDQSCIWAVKWHNSPWPPIICWAADTP